MENENQEPSKEEASKEPAIADTSTLIQKAEAVASRMEIENKKFEDLIKRQEDAAARIMLSGKATAGEPKKTAEEEKEEALNKMVKDAYSKYK